MPGWSWGAIRSCCSCFPFNRSELSEIVAESESIARSGSVSQSQPESEWKDLETRAEKIKSKIGILSEALKESLIKKRVLTKQEKNDLLEEIEKTIKHIDQVAQAAKKVRFSREEEGKENLKVLEAEIKALSKQKDSIEDRIPIEKETSALLDILVVLSQVVGIIWYVLVSCKILVAAVASSPIVVGVASVTSLLLVLMNAKQRIESRLTEIKAEDRKKLVNNCRLFIATFDRIKEKMDLSAMVGLNEKAQKHLEELQAFRQKYEEQGQELVALKEHNAGLQKQMQSQIAEQSAQHANQMNALMQQMQNLMQMQTTLQQNLLAAQLPKSTSTDFEGTTEGSSTVTNPKKANEGFAVQSTTSQKEIGIQKDISLQDIKDLLEKGEFNQAQLEELKNIIEVKREALKNADKFV